jgi:hypothetical protein
MIAAVCKRLAKIRSVFIALVILISGVLLISCLVPEKFQAELKINKDATYSFLYEGTLVFTQALGKDGKIDAATEKELAEPILEDLKKDTRYKDVSYIGNGRYKVRFEDSGDLKKQPFIFIDRSFNYFSARLDAKNHASVVFSGKVISANDVHKIQEVGVNIDGCIVLKTDGTVAESNGKKTFFGFGRDYYWDINMKEAPAAKMVIDLSK